MIITFILVFIALGLLSSFFSSAETAYISADKILLKSKADAGNGAANKSSILLEKPNRLLSLVLLGNNLVNVALSAIVTIFAVRYFPEQAEAVVIAGFILTFVILIFFETLPKAFAVKYSNSMTMFYSYIIFYLSVILWPVIVLIELFVEKVQKYISAEGDTSKGAGENDTMFFRNYILSYPQSLNPLHRDKLLRILDLDKVKLSEVMTPLLEAEGTNIRQDIDQIYDDLAKANHNHLIAYEDNITNPLGFINVKNAIMMHNLSGLTHPKMRDLIEEVDFLPDTIILLGLLDNFAQKDNPRAFVVDEYGTVQGIVTLRDLIVRALGSLESADMKEIQPGVWRVDLSASIRDINNKASWNIGKGNLQVSTLRGLIQEELEDLPRGQVCFELGEYRFEAEANNGKEASYVKIWRQPDEDN